MKESMYKHYDELPLFLNAELVAIVFFMVMTILSCYRVCF